MANEQEITLYAHSMSWYSWDWYKTCGLGRWMHCFVIWWQFSFVFKLLNCRLFYAGCRTKTDPPLPRISNTITAQPASVGGIDTTYPVLSVFLLWDKQRDPLSIGIGLPSPSAYVTHDSKEVDWWLLMVWVRECCIFFFFATGASFCSNYECSQILERKRPLCICFWHPSMIAAIHAVSTTPNEFITWLELMPYIDISTQLFLSCIYWS